MWGVHGGKPASFPDRYWVAGCKGTQYRRKCSLASAILGVHEGQTRKGNARADAYGVEQADVPKDFRQLELSRKLYEDPQSVLPQTRNRVTPAPSLTSGIYPLTAEIDGAVMHLQAEMPVTDLQRSGQIENITISISSIFYARRTAHIYLDTGERMFTTAGIMNPNVVVPRIRKIQESGAAESFSVAQSLLGPIQLGTSSGRRAKMMPIMFGTHIGRPVSEPGSPCAR